MFPVAIYLECVALAVCGLACLIFADKIPTPGAATTAGGTFTGRALGIALLALAIPLLPVKEKLWATSERLRLSFRLLPTVYLLLLVVSCAQAGLAWSWFWWAGAAVLIVVTIAAWFAPAPPWDQGGVVYAPPNERSSEQHILDSRENDEVKGRDPLTLHEARMKYAWNWFQYHADQRLKAFNFFLVVFGILLATYGAAVKEGLAVPPTSATPAAQGLSLLIAACGVVIAVAFLSIEVRNCELVNCGRKWLDYLEKRIGVSIREDDVGRHRLSPSAKRFATHCGLPPGVIKHTFWFAAIYALVTSAFAGAFCFAFFKFFV